MSNCVFPKCPNKRDHKHHIIYDPPMIVGLCYAHHEDITIVNTNEAFKKRRKLTSDERVEIWEAWLRGELVPEMTPWAAAWIGRWEKRRSRPKVPRRKGSRCRSIILEEKLTPYPNVKSWTRFSAMDTEGDEVFLSEGMAKEMKKMIKEGLFLT